MTKTKIKCYITGKSRPDTPEERVRQNVLQQLVEDYGYPKEHIDVEFTIQRGSTKKGEAADIVIFHSKKKNQNNIYLVIETKAPTIKIYDNQVFSYVTATTASWCALTNGSSWNYWKTNIGTKKTTKFCTFFAPASKSAWIKNALPRISGLNDGEKWSRKNNFEIPLAHSEILANKNTC